MRVPAPSTDVLQTQRWRRGVLALLCVFASGCGGGGGKADTPPQQQYEQISGKERIGWRQAAASLTEAGALIYLLYVDGARSSLTRVPCQAATQTEFDCSAQLPPISPGRHVLELAAQNEAGESPRSDPIYVEVTPSASSTASSDTASQREGETGVVGDFVACAADGTLCVRGVTLADMPGARAVTGAPDGTVFVITGENRINALEGNRWVPIAAEPPCQPETETQLADLAVSPGFLTDRRIYAAWSCKAPGASRELLLASYRELGDSLGEAQMASPLNIIHPAVALTAGPGRRLFFAARYSSGWNLSQTLPADVDVTQVPQVLMSLNSGAALESTAQRVFVFTGDTFITLLPSTAPVHTTVQRVFADLEDGRGLPAELAIAALPSGDSVWLARGAEIRRFSLATSEESGGVRLPGQILDLETVAGRTYALLMFDADARTQLVDLSIADIGRSGH